MTRSMRLAELLPDVGAVPGDLVVSGLTMDSRAVRPGDAFFAIGGFGTHELVKYYDLVRELLGSCWKHLRELPPVPTVEQRAALRVRELRRVPAVELDHVERHEARGDLLHAQADDVG